MRSITQRTIVSLGAGTLLLLTLIACGSQPAPTGPPSGPPDGPQLLWTEQFGSAGFEESRAVAVDSAGNAIVVGYTMGDLDGASQGGADVFVRALKPDGSLAWARQFGTAYDDVAYAVAADADGNVVVAGYTLGDVEGESAGFADVFVRMYDQAGGTLWTRQFGTAMAEDLRGVATDAAGNVYLAGSTGGDLEGGSAGGFDVFVRKYDASGTLGWTHQFGTDEDDGARAITTDSKGNVLVAGFTKGSLDGAGAGESDVFVRKLTSAGVPVWTHQFGTIDTDSPRGIATDSADNVVVVGRTKGAIGSVFAGPSDTFVRKLDEGGAHLWTRQFGTSGNDRPGGVAIDLLDNIFIAGYTNGVLAGESAGGDDVYVVRFSPTGEREWTAQFGTAAEDRARGVATDGAGNIIIAGNTLGALSGAGAGSQDVFVRTYEH